MVSVRVVLLVQAVQVGQVDWEAVQWLVAFPVVVVPASQVDQQRLLRASLQSAQQHLDRLPRCSKAAGQDNVLSTESVSRSLRTSNLKSHALLYTQTSSYRS